MTEAFLSPAFCSRVASIASINYNFTVNFYGRLNVYAHAKAAITGRQYGGILPVRSIGKYC